MLVTKKDIKYLGVQLANERKFTQHLEEVCGKADALMGTLRILLPNVNDPTGSVRKLYYGVRGSVMLCVAPVSANA